MRHKAQIRWALVGTYRGTIYSHMVRFTRKAVIESVLAEHRTYSSPKYNGTGLTDAQFWRQLKRRRGWTVRRISMRVLP
jgi:hypothetical protein